MNKRSRSKKRDPSYKPPPELHIVNSSRLVLDPRIERQRRREELAAQLDDNHLIGPKNLLGAARIAIAPDTVIFDERPPKKAAAIRWEDVEDDDTGPIIQPAMTLEASAKVDYLNPPPGVLGAGMGTEHGLPEYEFRSVWQTVLPELTSKNPTPWSQDPAVPPDDLKPTILSVVASVSLGNVLDLDDIAKRGTNLNYDPDSFTPLVMRLKTPKATALVFKSGKMIVTGTKSEAECNVAVRRIARIIQKIGYRVSVKGLQIQNISATCNLGFRVRVHLFGGDKLLSSQIGYHPELFTGVSIPLVRPKVKVMIFRTGSILITGAKAESELGEALRIVYPFAKMYAN